MADTEARPRGKCGGRAMGVTVTAVNSLPVAVLQRERGRGAHPRHGTTCIPHP